ncbi:O-antigen ligase family protein, partial [Candidatus Gracilibacteria bacterium]|nr:O-antigen ligase family protein [Candidatus Gracilibacteria bacterium]
FIFYLVFSQGFLKVRTLMMVLLSAISVSAFIGIFQYVFQESVGLYFLGEPHISADALDVARYSFANETVMRAYGTFSHPNVFAGFLLFAIFFSTYFWKESKGEYRVLLTLLMMVLLLALVLTFSRSGWLALFGGAMLYYAVSNVKLSVKYVSLAASLLLLFVVVFDLSDIIFSRIFIGDSNSIMERNLYYKAGWNMFLNSPFGVGAGNFTEVMQQFLSLKLEPWRFQPVHNIFILVLNELGVIALSIFMGIFVYVFAMMLKALKKIKDMEMNYMLLALCLGIFVIGLFDHYFISLYQGQFLFWVFLILFRMRFTSSR